MRVSNPGERAARQRERLFPRGFAEHGERVARVHREVGRFLHTRLADQRLGQPLRVRRVVKAEAAFDAQPFFVGGTLATFDADDGVVLDVVGELTPDTAIRTYR